DHDAGIGTNKIAGEGSNAFDDRDREREIAPVGGEPGCRFRQLGEDEIAARKVAGGNEAIEAERRGGAGIVDGTRQRAGDQWQAEGHDRDEACGEDRRAAVLVVTHGLAAPSPAGWLLPSAVGNWSDLSSPRGACGAPTVDVLHIRQSSSGGVRWTTRRG